MKKTILVSLSIFLLITCKESPEKKDYANEALNVTTSIYPETISKVFKAHGGIDTWNMMQSLYFEIEKEGQNEKTMTDLKSRKSIIDAASFLIGNDGTDVWLKEKDTATYKGNARFYHNLMFYFYAMPFIVGDDGINYEMVDSLEYEGKEYPGIKITYEAGIGDSSEDEYILYYDSDTHKMAWLAYTVTYYSKEKSPNFKLIKYSDWQTIEGLELPSILQWHVYTDGVIGDVRSEMHFANVALSKDSPNDVLFAQPEDAKLVE